MPSHRSTLAAVLAAPLLALPVAAASAQGWHHGGDGGGFAIMHQLDLTSQQQSQIHDLMQSSRAATASTRVSLHSVEAAIRTATFSTGSVSASQLTALMQQRESLQAQLDTARVSTIIGIRGVLTASQLATASSLQTQLASLHQQEHSLLGADQPAAAP